VKTGSGKPSRNLANASFAKQFTNQILAQDDDDNPLTVRGNKEK
jgi:hypothetical protein